MDSIQRKSLLYRTGVEYGDFTINHVQGCSHGCTYPCYAMLMSKRFGRVKSYREWLQPKIVANAIEILRAEIPRLRNRIRSVHLCFMTDPFMYGQQNVCDASLEIIKLLNDNGIPVTTLTKGTYPRELWDANHDERNEYGITLVSDKADYGRRFEPYAAPWYLRIRSIQLLSKLGRRTWVSIEPYPTPNIVNQNLQEILDRIAFVDRIVFGRLNYNSLSSSYEDQARYYSDMACQVMEFCRQHRIECHIKKGTMDRSDDEKLSLSGDTINRNTLQARC